MFSPSSWSSLPKEIIRFNVRLDCFKKQLKQYLFLQFNSTSTLRIRTFNFCSSDEILSIILVYYTHCKALLAIDEKSAIGYFILLRGFYRRGILVMCN